MAGQIGGSPTVLPVRNPALLNPRIHNRDNIARVQTLPARGGQPLARDRDNLYQRPENRARIATSDEVRNRDRSNIPRTRESITNNVFADRDGNVYRRNQNGWEQRDRGGWNRADTPAKRDRPQPGQLNRPSPSQRPSAETRPSTTNRPSAGVRPSGGQRPSASARPSTGSRPSRSGNLNREYNARQRGSSRTQTYQRNRAAPAARPRGARPSGRRRR